MVQKTLGTDALNTVASMSPSQSKGCGFESHQRKTVISNRLLLEPSVWVIANENQVTIQSYR